jgi:hypothetical protein
LQVLIVEGGPASLIGLLANLTGTKLRLSALKASLLRPSAQTGEGLRRLRPGAVDRLA